MKVGMKKNINIIAALTALLSATAAFITIRRAKAAYRKNATQIAITTDKEVSSTADDDLSEENHVEIEAELGHVEIMVEKEKEKQPEVTILHTEIKALNLSVRVYNALKLAGVNTLEDLTLKTEEDLSNMRNLGSKSLEEVGLKLKKMGYALR